MDSIETVNGIRDPDNVTVGALYYIPLNSVPGEPYPLENDIPTAPVPAPTSDNISAIVEHQKAHVPYGWIMGSLGVGLALIIVLVLIFVSLKSSCFSEGQGSHAKDHDEKSSSILLSAIICRKTYSFWTLPANLRSSSILLSDSSSPIETTTLTG